jgi:hypothetical protein
VRRDQSAPPRFGGLGQAPAAPPAYGLPIVSRRAPILQDVAARMAERPASDLRQDPVAWAYALRDAVALAKPDLVVSHLDPALEADALPLGAGDPVDALLDVEDLPARQPVAARLAGAAGAEADLEELADVAADLLAGLVEAYAAAGATTIVIAEWAASPAATAAGPLERAAAHARIEAVSWRVGEPGTGDLSLARVAAETPLAQLTTT